MPFLKEGCVLGNRALEIYRNGGKRKTDEEKKDAWKQLEEQLYRRWEILAVCQYKTGDRKVGGQVLVFHFISLIPVTSDCSWSTRHI